MKKEGLSDFGVLILRIGLAIVFIYFGVDKFVNLQANTEVMKALGIPLAGIITTIFYGVVEVVVGSFLIMGLFTRLVGGLATIMLSATLLTFWFKMHIFLQRDIGLLAIALFLLLNGGGRIGMDRYVRVKGFFERD